jgi:hypothetical protein
VRGAVFLKMTATASSIAPISRRDLINAILELQEEQFWDLVDIRLNRPKELRRLPGQEQEYLQIIDANDKPSIVERWSEQYLIDHVFLELATTKLLIVSHNGQCGITVYKYYNEAFRIFRYLPLAKPVPEFVINLSDLSSRVVAELKCLKHPFDVLKQAVGRIFENIDPVRYHQSIASKLQVRTEK